MTKSTSKDRLPVRRSLPGGKSNGAVSLESFAQRRGHTRALSEFKRRKQHKQNSTAISLRRYAKAMKQEGFTAGKGSSRKHVDDEHDEPHESTKDRKTKSNPFQKSSQLSRKQVHESLKRKTQKIENETNKQQRLKERRKQLVLHSKRTKKGQPIMKVMVGDMLKKIMKQNANA